MSEDESGSNYGDENVDGKFLLGLH